MLESSICLNLDSKTDWFNAFFIFVVYVDEKHSQMQDYRHVLLVSKCTAVLVSVYLNQEVVHLPRHLICALETFEQLPGIAEVLDGGLHQVVLNKKL